ncbi:MAG: alpha-amylase family glycosyl hydrolase, partial [Flammeovirgaceae bacterium]
IGIKDLPELTENEYGLTTGPKAHIKAIVQRWMDPNGDGDPSDGIDGWRLDVAEMVDIAFWKEFNTWVKAINPDAYITGEIWWHHYNEGEMFNAAPWLAPNIYDGVMNYRFARAVKQFIADQQTQITATAFIDSLKNIYADYPWERVLTCQNLLDSHDLDRFSSQIVNPDRLIDHQSDPYSNPNYLVRKPNQIEWQKFRLAVGLQFTLPGAPMIYYGDEAGMWGSDDPDQRKPMVWPEFQYQPEAHDEFGKTRPADVVKFDQSLFDYYKQLIAIRKAHEVFTNGKIAFIQTAQATKQLAFKRYTPNESMIVLVNNQAKEAFINLPVEQVGNQALTDLLSQQNFKAQKAIYSIQMPAYGIRILKP